MENSANNDEALFSQMVSQPSELKDEEISNLAQQLETEKDLRKEDRFVFILAIIILLNILFLRDFQSWAAPLGVVFLEVIFLILIARKLGMQEVASTIDSLLSRAAKGIGKSLD